jgi:AraC-like DNA-binding protein
VRIEKAKELLKNNVTVSEACFLVGFDSLSSFSGLFSKVVGKSPSNYLKHHQETQKKISLRPLSFVPGCYAYQHGWLDDKNSNFEEPDV